MGRLNHTVSGGIASFRTPCKVPIESLKFRFLPKQAGSGDPSPTNVRPITGWTGLNGRQEGKNLIDVSALTGTNKVWWKGSVINGYPNHCVTPKIPVKPGATYCLNRNSASQSYVSYFDKNGDYVSQETWDQYVPSRTIPDNVYFVGITIGTEYLTNPKPQFELGTKATDYANYISPRLFPVTFPDGQTIYGGYYDPAAGEIVAEWKAHTFDGTERIDEYSGSFTGGIRLANNTFDDCTSLGNMTKCDKAVLETTTPSDISRLGIRIGGGQYRFYFYVPDSMFDGEATADKFKTWLSENGMTVVAKLSTPIHIPIAPQSLEAYLDYNNFWSDANDITEVTYEVVESRHILAERIKAMGEESGHHRKVNWNQVCKYGDFQSANDWLTTLGYGTLSASDGVMKWTASRTPTQYYQTGFMQDKVYTQIPYNHKVLVMAKVRTSCSHANLQVRLYGMVTTSGGAHTYSYNQHIDANEWTDIKGFVRDRPEIPPSGFDGVDIRRFKVLLALNPSSSYEGIIDTGATLEAKNFMAFDLTQMFGLGNEPQTVAEFERICAINGIDLSTYQPYDAGSDRWMIVP